MLCATGYYGMDSCQVLAIVWVIAFSGQGLHMLRQESRSFTLTMKYREIPAAQYSSHTEHLH
jgi:hypothetical protein